MRNKIATIFNRSIPVAKTGLILFALTALLIAGASSGLRLDQDNQIESNIASQIEQVSIAPDPADISKDSENMNPGNPPNGEPSATYNQFVISSGLNHNQARFKLSKLISLNVTQSKRSHYKDRPVGSLAMVKSTLARQFTLVGAKPDGTG